MKSISLKTNTKNIIALMIAVFAIGITTYITIKAIQDGEIDTITSSILPLIGTWMGAIIAYYFAKENFDAAAAQYDKVIEKLTPEKKLKSIKVSEAMIPYSKIVWSELDEFKDKSIMSDILNSMVYIGFNRFLFFNKRKCAYIIHRSTFDRFITSQLLSNSSKPTNNLKLKDLLASQDENIAIYINHGIEYLSINSTLLDAKILFDDNSSCGDIIITQNGNKNEDVLGWITDAEITRNSNI
jgi:hypothetical protein